MRTIKLQGKPFKKPHKYNARATVVDGIRFDSQKEARVYQDLKLRQRAGEIVMFLRQVPLHLPGEVVMRIDFQVFEKSGVVRFLDAKGMVTKEWDAKRKIAESVYPITIETV